jgi:hypothetical protein
VVGEIRRTAQDSPNLAFTLPFFQISPRAPPPHISDSRLHFPDEGSRTCDAIRESRYFRYGVDRVARVVVSLPGDARALCVIKGRVFVSFRFVSFRGIAWFLACRPVRCGWAALGLGAGWCEIADKGLRSFAVTDRSRRDRS